LIGVNGVIWVARFAEDIVVLRVIVGLRTAVGLRVVVCEHVRSELIAIYIRFLTIAEHVVVLLSVTTKVVDCIVVFVATYIRVLIGVCRIMV